MKIEIKDILEILKEVGVLIDVNTLEINKPLKDQGVDSLDMANLFLNLQEKYNIEIPMEDVEKLQTIDDLINYIN
ncbi:phosphopantetheine-binding protein [Campylobacter lari]|uniref:acyl carrier protein n=1 Tax=Campylobacter lari TaxID=201 RepID=UPI001270BD7C|nr:phosphopantetheine-binding protein [Campylobacter lari]EAH8848253.1 acyl carrier protein [Campylobacter lari]EAK0493839.1 acyl carrier protein [Campylobacter lari]EAK5530541.1 acyl carrier protein [Campylobacter lari]EAK5847973.1 acyl carrier protein [Campylobacter lari]MCH3690181.1 phosphopantetheine-binding protein [Campylobacter lari]